jgi:RND family efflux transporter MFP subunit
MNKFSICLVTIFCLGGGLLAGCSAGDRSFNPDGVVSAATSAPAATRRAIPVEVLEVKSSAVAGEQLIPAVISVENTALVLAQRDGMLAELRGQEGMRVAKGEALARLNDDDQRPQLRQAELEIERSILEERQIASLVEVSRAELDQELALAKDGLTSKRQVDRAQFKLDANKHELERVRLYTQAARAKVEQVKVEIEKAVIRAPLDGIITHRYAKLGASVVKNDKLFEVSQLAPLQVRFQLAQGEGVRLGPGETVNLSAADSDIVVARARVRSLDPTADAASNTLGYWADVVGGANLIPGVAVNVRVARPAADATFWIPRTAFLAAADVRRAAAGTIFVLDENKCAARTVWVNAVEGSQVEINSGLTAGDRLILMPPADLKAGDVVMVKP